MSSQHRLLLVDDEPEILELLRLAFHDFEVDTALNASSAVELLGSKPFDVILTDIKMPGRSGLTLIDYALALRPGIAVIVMTGHHPEFASDTRVARWILKPFSITGIRATVHEVLSGGT